MGAGALKGAGAPKGASVPKRVSAPKGARAPNSSTPKRLANSPPGSPSELENTKRNKIHISPKVALCPPMLLRLPLNASQNPPLLLTPPFRKLHPCARLKPQPLPPIQNKEPTFTARLSPNHQLPATRPKPTKSFLPILAPHLSLPVLPLV